MNPAALEKEAAERAKDAATRMQQAADELRRGSDAKGDQQKAQEELSRTKEALEKEEKRILAQLKRRDFDKLKKVPIEAVLAHLRERSTGAENPVAFDRSCRS